MNDTADQEPMPLTAILGFGHHVIDLGARTVDHDGSPVEMEPQVFDVLAMLITHRERVVSKLEILDQVWGDRFVSPATLTSRIRDLRAALGDSGAEQAIIKTAHGRGFQFVAPIETIAGPHEAAAMPLHIGPLIGRETERRHITDALESSRLVTLVGPGGVGKTHLMRHTVLDRQALTVELAEVHVPDDVVRAVLLGVGGTERSGVSPQDALVDVLAGRSLLLAVDNCERVIGSVAPLVAHLLQQCPKLQVLATSRHPLQLADEHVIRIGPLSPDDARELLVTRADRHGIHLDDDDTVTAVCERLDHLPLAIELAASKTRAIPLETLAQLLDDRFAVLAADASDTPDHHRSLETAISWSLDLITDTQRDLLRDLSVLVGSFDLTAAGAVTGRAAPDVIVDMTGLVDASLVTFDASTGRYSLLESIRLYVDAQGVPATTIARHSGHVVLEAEAVGSLGAATFVRDVRTMTALLPSMRAVATRARSAGDRATLHRLVAASARFAEQAFAFEVLEWVEAAVELDRAGAARTPPSTTSCAVSLLSHAGRFDEAAAWLRDAEPDGSDERDLATLWHSYFTGDLAETDARAAAIRQRSADDSKSYERIVTAVVGHFLDKAAERPFDRSDIAVLEALALDDEALAAGAMLCRAIRLDWESDAEAALDLLTEVIALGSANGLAFLASGASTARSIVLALAPAAPSSLRGLRAALESYVESGSWQFALADFGATALALAHAGEHAVAAELLGTRRAEGYVGDASEAVASGALELVEQHLSPVAVQEALDRGAARETPAATRLALQTLATAIG